MSWDLESYKTALKRIRPYTSGFGAASGYDLRKANNWSSARKAAIRRYWNVINDLTTGHYSYNYRPRKKKNLVEARRARGVDHYKKLKVVPVRTVAEGYTDVGEPVIMKPRIRVTKKGRFQVRTGAVTRETLNIFDLGYTESDLAVDPLGIFEELLNDTDYSKYSITAGEFEVNRGGVTAVLDPVEVLPKIQQYIERYSLDNDPNHYYGDWMHGLVGYRFNASNLSGRINQELDYLRDLEKVKKQKKIINTKIKTSKQRIETLQHQISKINRHKYLSITLKRQLDAAISEQRKSATSKREKQLLNKVKKLGKENYKKVLSKELREYILDFKESQITKENRKIDKLILSRMRSFDYGQKN
jgi:hypothetical protein